MISDFRGEIEDSLKGLRRAAWPDGIQVTWIPNISKGKEIRSWNDSNKIATDRWFNKIIVRPTVYFTLKFDQATFKCTSTTRNLVCNIFDIVAGLLSIFLIYPLDEVQKSLEVQSISKLFALVCTKLISRPAIHRK